MTKTPAISVLMSVYNGETYLPEAIDSILTQTFSDFEFIVIDDGSTDTSASIITLHTDPRIVYIRNEKNIGLAMSLNKGIELARGKYIARMDADDVSLPHRLQTQFAFMEQNQDIMISGTWAQTIGSGKHHIIRHSTDPDELAVSLLFRTSLVHPTIILRKDFLLAHYLKYRNSNDDVAYVEDFDLYSRAVQYGKLANIGKVLLSYRRHEHQVSAENKKTQVEHAQKIIAGELRRLDMEPTPEDLWTAVSVKRYLFLENPLFPTTLQQLLTRILTSNNTKKVYNDRAMKKVFGGIWLEVCLALSLHYPMWRIFWIGTGRQWVQPTARNLVRMAKIFVRQYIS